MTGGVGLVHDWLTGQRGGENVLSAIARLAPRAPIYTLFHFPGSVDRELESHPIVTSFLQRAPLLERRYRQYLPLFPAALRTLPTTGHRLLVSSSHCVAKSARAGRSATHVCYCHTPMRYVWDQRQAYFGDERGALGWLRGKILDRLRRWDAATASRVDHYLANSRFVAGRIARYYGRTAEVVPPPVDTDSYRPTGEPRGDYCLMVAALAPYKKVDLGIDACREAGVPLVVVGDGPERARLARRADSSVRLLPRVESGELRRLYAGARCYLQPGIEDFGIATVEALACGTPVVALGEGGVLDIVEPERHGLLVAAASRESLAAAIDKAGRMQFNRLDLRSRAEEFSAERFSIRLKEQLRPFWPDTEGALV